MALDEELLYRLVGERVRAARQRLEPSFSQAQLAERLDMSRTSIVNIEAGRQRPPLHVLWRIADALETELALLVPDRAEYVARGKPVALDEQTVAEIEEAAEGDAATGQLLTEFVSRVRSRK